MSDPLTDQINVLTAKVEALLTLMNAKLASKSGKFDVVDMKDVVNHYRTVYYNHVGAYPSLGGRVWKAAKELLKAMPVEDIFASIDGAFEDPFFRDKIRELHVIASNPNKYRRMAPPPPPPVFVAQKHESSAPAEDDLEEINRRLGL